ncbi:hypothetical protein [Pleomorphomonas oryzae]|uniref:hypothetical protein n=1 Tax=Pleomorphomonas oryzae TaxID=261934 RepID=UPI000423051C|nr:hypothetical protein [Pleomorphomonas oryzae]
MARLISWPIGLDWTSREPLSGPRAVGSGSSESVASFVQTFSSPFGLWRWQFSLPALRGQLARRYRGMVTALHGGANAVRVDFKDPDGLSWDDLGIKMDVQRELIGEPWSNGQPWRLAGDPFGGQNWRPGKPWETVAAAAARGDSIVTLGTGSFGPKLDAGDLFGFVGVFAVHVVTEVLSGGRFRVWPPLRRAITTADYATLTPVMAMRLEGESGANLPRGVTVMENLAITLVEVEHRHVAQFFAD